MTLRAPSIKRTRHTVQEASGRVAPVGTVELDTIETREHSAWMQRVTEFVLANEAQIAALNVTITTTDGVVVNVTNQIRAVQADLDAHKARTDNPHSVTAAQAGADPSGTAASALASHVGATDPHSQYATDADLAVEANERTVADATEAEIRATADITEANARQFADYSERTDRIGADNLHAATTSTHGVGTGNDIVGTGTTQTLTNKTVPDLQFDLLGPVRTPIEGLVYWDADAKTLAVKLSGPDVALQLGQEQHIRCLNKTGADIPNGSVVYINGSHDQRPTIALGKADADATGKVRGVTTEEIKKNNAGYVTTHGLVHDVNTSGMTAGQTLYLSATTAGGFVNSSPAFPNYCIEVGVVTKVGTTDGAIFVSPALEATNHVMLNHLGAKDGKIGDIGGSNYTEFESDGTMVAHGAATTFNDLTGEVTKIKVVGVGIGENAANSSITMKTTADLNDYLYANFQMSHAWKEGTVIKPHIHYEQVQNAVPNFLFDYRWQINGGAKTTAWTPLICNGSAFTYVSGTLNQIAKTATGVTPTSYGISDILEFRIYRDNANTSTLFAGTDPYTADVEVMSIDIHIEQDMSGSRTEYSK